MALTSMKLKSLLKLTTLMLAAAVTVMPVPATASERSSHHKDNSATTSQSETVGTFTAYYAKKNFMVRSDDYKAETEFHVGDFFAESYGLLYNNTLKDLNESTYQLQYMGEKYTIPKSYVEARTYTMTQLSIASIGQSASFRSANGNVARIFKSSNNGHKGTDPEGCYIFSLVNTQKNYCIEGELETNGRFFELYPERIISGKKRMVMARPKNARWSDQSAYDNHGRLMTDLYECTDTFTCNLAYIGDLKALYINGTLFFRQQTNNTIDEDIDENDDEFLQGLIEYGAPRPTGNVENDAEALKNFVAGTILEDASYDESLEVVDLVFGALCDDFMKYYETKGKKAYDEFDKASDKVAEFLGFLLEAKKELESNGNLLDDNFSSSTNKDVVYESVDQMPQYPGGEVALGKYICSHIQYPTMAQENNIQGTVKFQFVVKKDGTIGDVKIVRSVDPYLDNEVVRVVRSIPQRFIPGYLNGEPVDVWSKIHDMNFKLQGTN